MSDRRKAPTHRQAVAFTLVEMLVVISIIALLISVLLPSLRQARAAAQAVKCGVQLRQMGIGIHQYTGDWKGMFPVPGYYSHSFPDQMAMQLNLDGYDHHISAMAQTIDEPTARFKYRADGGTVTDWYRLPKAVKNASIFRCPSQDELPEKSEIDAGTVPLHRRLDYYSHYSYNRHLGSPSYFSTLRPLRVEDLQAPSNTAVVVCGGGDFLPYQRLIYTDTYVFNLNRADTAGAWHNDRGNILFTDGHTRSLELNFDIPDWNGTSGRSYLFDAGIVVHPRKAVPRW